MVKIKMLTAYYMLAHKRRQEWANWKWRIFAILAVLAIMFFVRDYLTANYFTTVEFAKPGGEPAAFLLSDKLFYWFATGVMIGLVAMALIYEGEFVLGLLKLARGVESEFDKDARAVGKGISDAEKLIEREVERDVETGVDLVTPAWSKRLQAKLAKARKKQGLQGPPKRSGGKRAKSI